MVRIIRIDELNFVLITSGAINRIIVYYRCISNNYVLVNQILYTFCGGVPISLDICFEIMENNFDCLTAFGSNRITRNSICCKIRTKI